MAIDRNAATRRTRYPIASSSTLFLSHFPKADRSLCFSKIREKFSNHRVDSPGTRTYEARMTWVVMVVANGDGGGGGGGRR